MSAQALDQMDIPEGGIAGFVMSDEDFAALEREEAKKSYGEKGIAEFKDVANRMASYGRGGDDRIAHVATGEIVIPRPLIENNPALKDSIFGHLRELGVDDPEQYVVGSAANSINPETGLREFGFFSKIFRGVKKIVKKVVKVIKKVAPIVLPIAFAMTPLGPIYGAALGSGIGTLINGGSLGDALKSAVIAGGTGALFQGFTGAGDFTTNISDALANPMARVSQTATGIGDAFSSGNISDAFKDFTPTAQAAANATNPAAGQAVTTQQTAAQATQPAFPGASAAETATYNEMMGLNAAQPAFPGASAAETNTYNLMMEGNAAQPAFPGASPLETADYNLMMKGNAGAGGTTTAATGATGSGGIMDTLKEYGSKAMDFISGAPDPTAAEINSKAAELMAANPNLGSAEAVKLATNELTPGMVAKYGPAAGLALGTTALAGGFEAPPQEDPGIVARDEAGNAITGETLVTQNPADYIVQNTTPKYADYAPQINTPQASFGNVSVPTQYTYNPYAASQFFANPFYRPVRAADGGAIYPRRNGGIMPDEGVPGKDSVRALLMPGEFVMTTKAVRGMGGGDLKKGINNMYGVMRNLEMKGQVA